MIIIGLLACVVCLVAGALAGVREGRRQAFEEAAEMAGRRSVELGRLHRPLAAAEVAALAARVRVRS